MNAITRRAALGWRVLLKCQDANFKLKDSDGGQEKLATRQHCSPDAHLGRLMRFAVPWLGNHVGIKYEHFAHSIQRRTFDLQIERKRVELDGSFVRETCMRR